MKNKVVASCKKVTQRNADTGEVREQFVINTIDGVSIWSETPIMGGQVIQVQEKKAGDKYKDSKGIEKTVEKDGYLFQGQIGGTAELQAIVTNKELLAKIDL